MEYKEILVENVNIVINDYKVGCICLKDQLITAYLFDGNFHRQDGPALIKLEPLYVNNKLLYGDDATGATVYFGKCCYYYRFGKLHCETGPAFIDYDICDKIVDQKYWLFDKSLTKEEWENQIQTKLYW